MPDVRWLGRHWRDGTPLDRTTRRNLPLVRHRDAPDRNVRQLRLRRRSQPVATPSVQRSQPVATPSLLVPPVTHEMSACDPGSPFPGSVVRRGGRVWG